MNRDGPIDISIIVVSYQTRDMTLTCLDSIIRETKKTTYEVFVVDNASTDGSAESIAQKFPQFKLFAQSQNLGFAAANNFAAQFASGTYILLLNPDTIVLEGAIDELVEFARGHPSNRIWGGRTLFGDGSLNPSSCWKNATLWSTFCFTLGLTAISKSFFFNPETYGSWRRDTVRPVDVVTGCFLLIDRALWSELGGFDPVFFMYGEEADLCARARMLGARPILTPSATIVHHGGASESSRAEQRIKVLAGRVTLMRRHWRPVQRIIGYSLYSLLPLIRWTVFKAASLATGNRRTEQAAQQWAYVWKNRKRWIFGWPGA